MLGFFEKTGYTFFPVEFNTALLANLAYSKSPADLCLLGITVDIQLAGEHPKSLDVINIMGEYREVPVKISKGVAFPDYSKVAMDGCYSFRKKR